MTDDETNQIEAAVAAYRTQLAAAADLGRADAAEIEEHLRLLIGELLEHGVPAAVAIEEAAHRLGEPAAIGLEHARVRTGFGTKLPAWRARMAAVAILAQIVMMFMTWPRSRELLGGGELALATLLAGALALRSSWARGVLLGACAYQVVWSVVCPWPVSLEMIVLSVIAAALLAPWKRGELRWPGAALALLYPAYVGSTWALALSITDRSGHVVLPSGAYLGVACVLVAGAGIVLRAKWAAIPALGAAFAQLAAVTFAWSIHGSHHAPIDEWARLSMLMILGLGATCAIAVAAIAWRSGRASVGSLRDVLA